MNSVEWGEYKLGDLFDIKNTLSFNTDMLTDGNEYDYITRTSLNQGILQTTGFVNDENINNAGTWSLGLLQMDFFYRNKPWYAGQFVRKIIPKIEIPQNATLYFTTVLNKLKPILLSVLVRNVDETFLNTTINLPINAKNKISVAHPISFQLHISVWPYSQRLLQFALALILEIYGFANQYEDLGDSRGVGA